MINKDALATIINNARSDDLNLKRVAFCSPGGHRILKYLYKTRPDFSMAGAARQVLEHAIENSEAQHLWSIIFDELPPYRRKLRDYWQGVVLVNVREDIIKQVIEETPAYSDCTVQIYSPRLAVYFRYMRLDNTKYSISKAAAQIFENEMNQMYPAVWKRLSRIL